MRLLLDTHIFLWAIIDSRKLKSNARHILTAASAVYVSAASIWELAIKVRLGKLHGDPLKMAEAIESSGFLELPVTSQHAARVALLPSHHSDPFDRLLVAQALVEPLVLVTADRVLAAYGPTVQVV